jgi:phosphoribosylformylglycinamidine synthase
MKAAVIVFPGSNCDRDIADALHRISGHAPHMIWHKNHDLPSGLDLIALPGGFSHGDYLRSGAIAAQAPIMRAVKTFAEAGGAVLGICNGFQILTEAGLLPGGLMRNAGLKFICRDVWLKVETDKTIYTRHYDTSTAIRIPIAHHDGNYTADAQTLDMLAKEDRIAFRYADPTGSVSDQSNPNGSAQAIAGVLSANRRVLGLMPHPERLIEAALGGTDGRPLFTSLMEAFA